MNLFRRKFYEQTVVEVIRDSAFYIALITELMMIIIDKSAFVNPIESYVWRFTFILCFVTVLCTRYKWKEWIFFAIFLLIGFVSYRATGRNEILRLVMLLMAMKEIDYKITLKLTFWVLTGGSVLIMIFAFTGMLGTISYYADYGRRGYETRYSFGMGHPNAFHCMFFSLMILGICVWFDKIRWWHLLIFLGADALVYYFTGSRTGFLVTAFALLVAFCFVVFKRARRHLWVYILCDIIIVLVFAFSIYAAIVQSNTPLTYLFDMATNRRIHGAVEQVNAGIGYWTLFGKSAYTEFFDMGIIRLFYWFGWAGGLLYLGAMLYLIRKARKEQEYGLALMTVTFTVYTLAEAHFISDYLLRNYLWLYMGGMLFIKHTQKKLAAEKGKA